MDVAALTHTGASAGANATPQGAAANAAAEIGKEALNAAAAALSDSGPATSGVSGGVKFGDVSNVSGGGGFGLSNKKLMTIGAFVLGGMLIYGLTMGKGRR